MSSTQRPPQIDTSNLPLTTPAGPTSLQLEKDAARAMSSTDSWQPMLDRKQSYKMEEQKHDLQMSGLSDSVKPGASGFTERA